MIKTEFGRTQRLRVILGKTNNSQIELENFKFSKPNFGNS